MSHVDAIFENVALRALAARPSGGFRPNGSPASVSMRVELDLTGEGLWVPYRTFEVESGKPLEHDFPIALQSKNQSTPTHMLRCTQA